MITKVKSIMDEMAELNADYNKQVFEQVVDFNDKFRDAALAEHDKF